jgi:glycosyltransferase involved in cell wall biosynthesis
MKAEVIYSIATRIGGPGLGLTSYNAVKALYEAGFLKKAVCYGNRSDIEKSKFLTLRGNPAKLLFFLPGHYYQPLRKGFLDYVTSRQILKYGCDVFHGWSHQALKSIRAARKTGSIAVLECGSTHRLFREKILNEEYLKFGIKPKKYLERTRDADLEEMERADFIFVISEFAKSTFVKEGVPEQKLVVLGRGADPGKFTYREKKDNIFRVLFVGRIGIRKGVQYLLEAWKELKLNNAELVLAGNIEDSFRPLLENYKKLKNVVIPGFLKDPVEAYYNATVFAFPSLEDGGAKATYEAMTAGLPLITTENSGSLIRDGIDGFVVPVRDSESIKRKIVFFYENPDKARWMGANALENVRQHTWQHYREDLVNAYRKILGI